MIGFTYLFALLFSIAGMIILDWRYHLAFFHDSRRTALTLLIGTGVFILWDILGIQLGIFFDGSSELTTGILIAPELPLEEFFFLFFLCYFTLIVYRVVETK